MKNYILLTILSFILPLVCEAQKITLGSCETKDGGLYQGEMVSGKPHGKGRTEYKNGDTYEGSYVKGKRQGYGVYTFSDGEKYDGEWFQDQQHGRGTYYFMNNNKYVGLWYKDYQQGHGVMYYYNGDKYDGEWYQDKRNGKGRYTYSGGAYYEGEWKDDKKNGKGFLTGLMVRPTTECGLITCAQVKERTNMLMVTFMSAIGWKMYKTAKVSINSRTVICMKVTMFAANVQVTGFSLLPMATGTQGILPVVIRMDMVS